MCPGPTTTETKNVNILPINGTHYYTQRVLKARCNMIPFITQTTQPFFLTVYIIVCTRSPTHTSHYNLHL